METGVYPNLSNEEYHGHKDSISRSAIMEFDDSPYKYWAHYINPQRPLRLQTPQMLFGEAFHTFVLELEEFENRFIIEPELQKSPPRVLLKNVGRPTFNAYKVEKAKIDLINNKVKEDFEEQAENKKILTFSDFKKLTEMKDRLLTNKRVIQLLEEARIEHSFFWMDKDSGLLIKARPDILQGGIMIDLKTCKNASPHGFQSAMIEGGYHIQGAMCVDALQEVEDIQIKCVVNIAIEKEYPYAISLPVIDEIALEYGQKKYKEVLLNIKSCKEQNEWPDYDVYTASLPKWAL